MSMIDGIRLVQLAKRFLAAAEELSGQGGKGWRFPVPHYLACHALELALKASLAATDGVTERALKRVGHDLGAALSLVDVRDPTVTARLTKEHRAAIRWINPLYNGKQLEYTATGHAGRSLNVPSVECLVDAARQVARHLNGRFRAQMREIVGHQRPVK